MSAGFKYEDWSDGVVTYGVIAFPTRKMTSHMHIHSQVELVLVERGELDAIVDDQHFFIREGEGILICPHVTHRLKSDSEETLSNHLIFSTEFIPDFKNFFESAKVPYVRIRNDSCPDFARAQIGFLKQHVKTYSYGKTVLKGMLTVLLSGIMPAYSGVDFEKYSDRSQGFEICRQLLMYVDSNISQDLSLEKISKAMNIVPSYVSMVFSRNFKISLNSYITKKRISLAKSLLSSSHKSITEIAFESGFSSIRSFNRRFRESEGMTPSEYRSSFMKQSS